MPCHPTWPPHTKLSLILETLKFVNYSYFAKIMTRRPRHGNLTKALSISGVTKVASAINPFTPKSDQLQFSLSVS